MNTEVEIDLIELIKVILRKWLFISIITISVALVAGIYSYVVLDDIYTAKSSLVVEDAGTIDDYIEITTSDRVLEELRLSLDIDLSNETLRDMIVVSNIKDTLIINLEVESQDNELAQDIANEAVSIVKNLSTDFEGLNGIEILDIAAVPTIPSSGPNRLLYIAVGVLLGGMIGVGIVLAFEFLGKTIKTGKDIEDILGLRLLGTIPNYYMEEERGL